MTTLRELIELHKSQIIGLWIAKCLEVYPSDSRNFFAKKKNRFANPVGAALERGVENFVAGLIQDETPEILAAHLEEIVQVRSVQQIEPSNALGFVLLLKGVIGEILDKEEHSDLEQAFDEMAAKIDATSLKTFDLYLKYRERLFDIRVNDVKRRVSYLLKRTSFFNNDNDSDLNSKSKNLEPGEDRPPGR